MSVSKAELARLAHELNSHDVDQGEDDGLVYLVMEYVPGPNLRDLLTERGRLDPTEALDVIESGAPRLRAAAARMAW